MTSTQPQEEVKKGKSVVIVNGQEKVHSKCVERNLCFQELTCKIVRFFCFLFLSASVVAFSLFELQPLSIEKRSGEILKNSEEV